MTLFLLRGHLNSISTRSFWKFEQLLALRLYESFFFKILALNVHFSLESDHQLIVDQLKNHWDTSQTEVKELRDQMANMKRELLEERYDKQRSTLLHVLVTKLKTELDKKEKQMEFLKHVAQELHSRISCDDKSSSSNESPILDPTDNDEVIKLEEMINSLKQEIVQLEKTVDNQKKQMQSRQAEVFVSCFHSNASFQILLFRFKIGEPSTMNKAS